MERVEGYGGNEKAWDELMVQVIELEASVNLKKREMEILIETLNETIEFAP